MLRLAAILLGIIGGGAIGLFGGFAYFAITDPNPSVPGGAAMSDGLIIAFVLLPIGAIGGGIIGAILPVNPK
jgi:hypothetical protein